MSNAPTHSVHSAIATGPLLLLLFFLIGCLAPGSALAVDGSDALNFRTISDGCGPFGVGKYEAQDTSISYCMNQDCPGPSKPGGPWRTYNQGWTWLDDEFAAIVCHGSPSNTSFGGHNLSPDLARAATQIAVWMLKGTTHPDGTYSYTNSKGVARSGRFYENAEAVAAARWLYDSAKSGSIKAAPHRARRYHGPVSGEGRHQDMLYVLPAVSVSFQKQSSQADITAGNDTYRLGGATFDIFENAGDARVGTIQTDENGRVQATLLPNTAYYLVETKAPTGYIPRSDRIAFTTQNSGEHVTVNEQPGAITLRIAKVDAATDAGTQVGASLAGAEFTCVSQSTPGWTRTLTTDEGGQAILNDVPLGTLTIYESKAPEGYLISNDCWSYTVGAEQLGDTGIVELESRIPNIPIAFDLEISKFKDHGDNDESGLEQPAGGVVFEVVSNSSQQVVGTLTTNVYGFASTKDQPEAWFGAGKRPAGAHGAIPYDRAGYTVREVAETVPEGFKQAGEWTITAEQTADGAELQYIIDNHALSTHLQIVKRDAQTGGTVPLSMVADVYTELSPQSIVRKNQKETVTITGESESGDSNAIKAAVDDIVAKYELPDGVEVGEGDTAASQIAETTGTLMLALAVAILLVYFILATQFNSFSLPIAIMLILPIGLLGSMILLWPTGNHVSMVALLGVIILAGTVVNSSIVLIDYTLQRRQRGEDKNTAILNACPRRVRPVLMTAMTTILGLVPMVCSSGEGSEMMKPMGVVMMTGMVISTIATLFITPVYYSLTDSVASRLSGLFKKIKLPKFNFHKKNPQQ